MEEATPIHVRITSLRIARIDEYKWILASRIHLLRHKFSNFLYFT